MVVRPNSCRLLQFHPFIYFGNQGEDGGSRAVSGSMNGHSKFLLPALDRANAATDISCNFLPGLQGMPFGARGETKDSQKLMTQVVSIHCLRTHTRQ